MELLKLEQTRTTPAVIMDSNKGFIEISGRSLPEDAQKFYAPLEDWLINYIKVPHEKTVVDFKLDYFNTSSSKWLITLFKVLHDLSNDNHDITISWYYDSEDLLEYIEEIMDIYELTIDTYEID